MGKAVCVYCASSRLVAPEYFRLAEDVGQALAARGWTLVFGGSDAGLMGRLAHTVRESGGQVVGIIPRVLHDAGLSFQTADELVVVEDLRERKALMDRRADGFLAMPGGFGTLDETIEAVTLRLLKQHAKPVVFLNHQGFYDPLFQFFENLYRARFALEQAREIYYAAPDIDSALDLIANHAIPPHLEDWAPWG